eukprot:CAMPEP_0113281692 /NCGR_PEP_ID=MMETSP0008_2-20120614/28436_1 /TAXON_ID=97485 /ORGANISM="Prymnesium parvum" /LENGTH=66 /DNA_ID=CAMNT_0000132125 /DNA_START=233 /DNA_END=430 /DNA_ORIENTATION=+ /assembly_acc=CAM_ASM_000153
MSVSCMCKIHENGRYWRHKMQLALHLVHPQVQHIDVPRLLVVALKEARAREQGVAQVLLQRWRHPS